MVVVPIKSLCDPVVSSEPIKTFTVEIKFKAHQIQTLLPSKLHESQNGALIRSIFRALSLKQYLQESFHCKHSVNIAQVSHGA